MALWGNTDALASTPKFVARKAFIDSTAVDTTAETLNILSSNTGFATGDAVVYSIAGGTVIGGLVDATTYYVRTVGAGLIELYNTYANAINTAVTTGRLNITGAGVGTHTLQRTGAANVFGDHVNNGRAIVFVDAQEAQTAANKAKGITGAGWWLYRTYTDAQSTTRHKAECLVAMAVGAGDAGDAEDTITVDLAITFGTQPSNVSVTAPAAATFTVAATINGDVPLSYQWEIQQEGTGSWTAITGATGTSYTTGATATGDGAGATDGDKYRVVVSGGGITATSNAATLTVA